LITACKSFEFLERSFMQIKHIYATFYKSNSFAIQIQAPGYKTLMYSAWK